MFSKVTVASILAATLVVASPLLKRSNGFATQYDPTVGAGSCGTVESDQDMIVALSRGVMQASAVDGNPNNDANCAKTITASYQGHTITARIRDTCYACSDNDIDLSAAAFSALTGGLVNTKVFGVDWNIN